MEVAMPRKKNDMTVFSVACYKGAPMTVRAVDVDAEPDAAVAARGWGALADLFAEFIVNRMSDDKENALCPPTAKSR